MKLILKNNHIIEIKKDKEIFRYGFDCRPIACSDCPFGYCVYKKSYRKGTIKDMIKECKQGMKEKVKFIYY